MFVEMFESKDIIDARNKRKQFVEELRKDIDPRKQYEIDVLKDTEAIKSDWEKVGKDFPIR